MVKWRDAWFVLQVLRAGEGVSTRPTPQCQVKMKVRGMLLSGGIVERHSSLAFTVGDGDVIQGEALWSRDAHMTCV